MASFASRRALAAERPVEAAVDVAGTAAAAARVVPSAAAREAASREAAAAAAEVLAAAAEVLVAAEAEVMAGVAAEAVKLAVAPAAVAAVGREVASWGLAELAELVATEAVAVAAVAALAVAVAAVAAVAALADWASLSSPGSTVRPAGPLRRFCHDLEWSNSTARLFRLAPNGLLRASPRDWCHRARPCPCERPPGHAPRRALSADPSCFEPCSGRPSN